MRTKDEGDYHEKTILFFSCRPTGCITVGCDVNLVQRFDIFRKHPDLLPRFWKALRVGVDNIQNYIEHQLTPESFLEIDSKEDMNKECYQELKERMEEIRDIGDLRYLYTAKRNDEGTLVYVVGGLPEDADDFRYPGDAIEPEIQSEWERALSGETVLPEKILDTDWGNIFIAYYPLHNESGEVVGALGIEVAADIEAEAVHDKSIIQRHGKY